MSKTKMNKTRFAKPKTSTKNVEDPRIRFYRIANEKGMQNNELFARFMAKRFPEETDGGYIREWADRFMSGNPSAYMDLKSIKVYTDLIKEY